MKIVDVMADQLVGGRCVYVIKNTVNGKLYVGQTSAFGVRMHTHMSRSRNRSYNLPLYNAMRKHGLQAVEVEVLEGNVEGLEDVSRLEIGYIEKYGCQVPSGYNLTEGGEGRPGHKHTDEWKRQASARLMGNKRALGTKHTDEWKARASARMLGNQHALGMVHAQEFRDERRRRFLESNPRKKFDDAQKAEIFTAYMSMDAKSQRKIAKQFGCSQNTVARIVRQLSTKYD
jgi:group I intron endonuclease